jgi:hypothetical protein
VGEPVSRLAEFSKYPLIRHRTIGADGDSLNVTTQSKYGREAEFARVTFRDSREVAAGIPRGCDPR